MRLGGVILISVIHNKVDWGVRRRAYITANPA